MWPEDSQEAALLWVPVGFHARCCQWLGLRFLVWRKLSSQEAMRSKGNEGCAGAQRAARPSLLQEASQDGTGNQELSPPVPRNFVSEVHKSQAQALPPSPTHGVSEQDIDLEISSVAADTLARLGPGSEHRLGSGEQENLTDFTFNPGRKEHPSLPHWR